MLRIYLDEDVYVWRIYLDEDIYMWRIYTCVHGSLYQCTISFH